MKDTVITYVLHRTPLFIKNINVYVSKYQFVSSIGTRFNNSIV